MTKGPPFQLLMRFSLPLLAGNVLQQLYNLADSSVSGHFIGPTALSAVSNGYIIILMMVTLFSGAAAGGAIVIAQYFGQGEDEKLQETVETMYFGMAAVVLPLTAAGWFCAPLLLELFRVPPDVLPGAAAYVQIIFLGVLGVLGYNINTGILNGLGDSRTSLKFLAVSSFSNIAMDLLFVPVLGWGIRGAALATVLSQTLAWLLGIGYINRHYTRIHIRFPRIPNNFSLLWRVLRIGIPSCLSSLQYTIGIMLIQSLINSFGSDFIAGVSAATRIEGFLYMPILSFSSAVSTYAAQNAGACQFSRVREGVRVASAALAMICILLSAIVIPLGRPLSQLLFGLETESANACMAYLIRAVLPSCLLGILYIVNGALRGTGAVMLPTVSGIIALWIVRVPAAYFLSARFGAEWMFLSYPIGWICGLCISGMYYFSGRWQLAGRVPSS